MAQQKQHIQEMRKRQAQIQVQRQIAVQQAAIAGPVVEIDGDQLSAALSQTSLIWLDIIDVEVKEWIVSRYIQWYREQAITIGKPPMHYVTLIEGIAREDRDFLQQPFDRVLKLVAIMEYDFDTGENKDTLARQVLGEQNYRRNRQRLGLP